MRSVEIVPLMRVIESQVCVDIQIRTADPKKRATHRNRIKYSRMDETSRTNRGSSPSNYFD
ncbi:hypothetical protein KY285_033990 [Solanum tuberosum]|nr:hypothetical protein KY285_033990 [Solanum tuberosum]